MDAHDLLWLNGNDYRQEPLLVRKSVQSQVVPSGSNGILEAQYVLRNGFDFFHEICRRNLEGMVAKWTPGLYDVDGPRPWVKVKNPGYTQAVGRAEQFRRR